MLQVAWICFSIASALANPWNARVVLQGFWWNYWNNNYPNDWATYLADLAPRLRAVGIDAVWIPPTVKNQNATGSVGYAPFAGAIAGERSGSLVATEMGLASAFGLHNAEIRGSLFIGPRTITLLRFIREPFLLAFSTSSSEAAYPKTVEQLERFGVSNRIVSFVRSASFSQSMANASPSRRTM